MIRLYDFAPIPCHLRVSEESRGSGKRRLLFTIHSKFRLQSAFCFVILSVSEESGGSEQEGEHVRTL